MLGDLLESRASGRGQRVGWVRGSSSAGFGLMAFTAGKIADTFAINIPFYISAALLAVAFVLALGLKEERFKRDRVPATFEWRSAWQAFLARFRDAWAVIGGRDEALTATPSAPAPSCRWRRCWSRRSFSR